MDNSRCIGWLVELVQQMLVRCVELAPLCVLWKVWNSCTFEGVEVSEVQLRLSLFGYSVIGQLSWV